MDKLRAKICTFFIMPNPQKMHTCKVKQVFKVEIDEEGSQFSQSSARVNFTCRLCNYLGRNERISQRKFQFFSEVM